MMWWHFTVLSIRKDRKMLAQQWGTNGQSHTHHVVVHTLCTIPDAVIAMAKQSMTETKEIHSL